MSIATLLTELEDFLTTTFAAVDAWFDQPAPLLATRPPTTAGRAPKS